MWRRSGDDLPALGRSYSRQEQAEREALFDRALADIQALVLEGEPDRDRIAGTVARLACWALDIDDDRIETLLKDDFVAVARDLAAHARRLDAAVTTVDILQACRNAWTACGLQALLGKPPHLSPAIFGYSMLYPYSDNYLDDERVSREAKLRFSARFRQRLAGGNVTPTDGLETTTWELISRIEGQWPREAHPDVYDCLLAIHRAQEKSLEQQRTARHGDADILRLSFAKGGTSVLADAYLATGALSEAERYFAFGWGVVLQLGDDLQDLADDRERGFHTLFSRAADSGRLDELTTQTLNFTSCVMQSMSALPNGAEHLRELLRKNSFALLITAAGEYGELYSESYLRQLESYSPLRFCFLKSRKERVARWLGPDACLVEDLLLQA